MRASIRTALARAPKAALSSASARAARHASSTAATDADRHRSTIFDRRNVEFLLWEQPAFAAQAGDRDTLGAMLDAAEALVTEHATADAVADAHEPVWDPATGAVSIPAETRAMLKAHREGGFTLIGAAVEDGGLGLSLTASTAINSILSCGFTSGLGGFYALTHCAAKLITAHGTPAQRDAYVPPLVEGTFGGTMALSEAQSGSSLSELSCRARHVSGDEYRLSGNKMWTSGFDHGCFENIVHLVLAKIDGANTPKGNRGISLFIVPKLLPDGSANDIALNGLNHKMGQRALPNSYWSLGDANDECVGYLVGGVQHAGLMQMFTMMNDMRVAVGLHAACCGVRGFQESLAYAKERVQGSALGRRAQIPIIQHADVRRQLLAQKALSEGALHLCFLAASLVDQPDNKAAATLLDVLVPIVKAWPSEHALEANKWAIQVLGGYGYTRDYPVERLYRDNRLNMIHEGTNGIQALDLLGRKAVMSDGAATRALAKAMATDAALSGKALPDLAADLGAAVERYGATTALLGAELARNPERALANAHEYLNMVGHTVVAWCWLREAAAAHAALNAGAAGADVPCYEGKVATARYFFKHELVKTRAQADLLASFETSTLDMAPGYF